MFCDAGCKVLHDTHECHVYHNGKIALTGTCHPTTGMWHLPNNPQHDFTNNIAPLQLETPDMHLHSAFLTVYTLPYKQ